MCRITKNRFPTSQCYQPLKMVVNFVTCREISSKCFLLVAVSRLRTMPRVEGIGVSGPVIWVLLAVLASYSKDWVLTIAKSVIQIN